MALTKVSSSLVSDDAVTSAKIVDGGIATADIAANAVTSAKIAQNSILTKHIDDGQVTTDQLGADAVTAAKIADDAISEEHLDITVITSLTEVAAATGDLLMVADVSDSNALKKIPVSSILAGTLTTAAQGNITSLGTLSALNVTGNVTQGNGDYLYTGGGNFDIKHTIASQNIVFSTTPSGGSATEVLRITHDGKLSKISGDFTLDVAGDITLDADGGEFKFLDGGTESLVIGKTSGSPYIYPTAQDSDLIILGNDGGSQITALTLDMSAGGAATFNDSVFVGNHLYLGDSKKAIFGAGEDLNIYHDATDTFIENNTGYMAIRTVTANSYLYLHGDNVHLRSQTGNEAMLTGTKDGAVTLYHNNIAKLATNSGGVTVTGTLITDGLSLGDNETAYFGAGTDLRIYHDGNSKIETGSGSAGDLYIAAQGANHDLYLRADDDIKIQPQGGEDGITLVGNGAVTLFHDAVAKLATTSGGVNITGGLSIGGTEVINSSRNALNLTNLVVDNLDFGGTTITGSGSNDIVVDSGGRIDLSADDNGEIRLFDGSSMYAQFKDDDDRLKIQSLIQDKDMMFVGNDNGSEVTALLLDMSEAGAATFAGDLQAPGIYVGSTNTSYDLYNNGTTYLNGAVTIDANLTLTSDGTITQSVGSGGGVYHAITHTGNEAWTWAAQSGSGSDDYLDVGISGGTRVMSWHEDGKVGIGTTSPGGSLHIHKTGGNNTVLLTNNTNTAGTYTDLKWAYATSGEYSSGLRFKQVDTSHGGQLEFFTDNSSGTYTQRMTLDEDGRVGINDDLSNGDLSHVIPAGTLVHKREGWHGGQRTHYGRTLKYSEGLSWTDAVKIDWNNSSWGAVNMRIKGQGYYNPGDAFDVVIGFQSHVAHASANYSVTSNAEGTYTHFINIVTTTTGETVIQQRNSNNTSTTEDIVFLYEWVTNNRSDQVIAVIDL